MIRLVPLKLSLEARLVYMTISNTNTKKLMIIMKHVLLFISIIIIVLLTGCMQQSHIEPKDLLCEAKLNPTGISTTQPRFNWKNEAAVNEAGQSAYQIIVASSPSLLQEGKADLWNSGKVSSSKSVWIPYQGEELESRSVACWKIRVWDQDDAPSKWSNVAHFSVGLLTGSDWTGEYIGSQAENGPDIAPLLRKSIHVNDTYEELFMHVNSLGYHELYVNNQKVGDAVLAPAESQFDKRSFSLSYDLSSYLVEGENAIVLWLGYGWYQKAFDRVHEGPIVRAQLDGLKNGRWETVLTSDENWKASESEYSAIIPDDEYRFGYEILNANKIISGFSDPGFDDSNWKQVSVFQVPDHLVTPQVVELNRVQEDITAKEVRKIDDQVYMVDMGKNLTGGLKINFPVLPEGHEISIQYTDYLLAEEKRSYEKRFDKEGKVIIVQDSELSSPKKNRLYNLQHDKYISSGKEGSFTTRFNYRAFRYIKISNLPLSIEKEAITARLIHTDFRQAASFSCSDTLLNQLHELFAYTLKCLTIGGKIVDCPHYERLGYGGDGNACTMTAQTFYDLSPLYSTWLTHWVDCIQPDGGMPHTAPNFWRSGGGPYWCTFIVKATWNTYLNYGDRKVLETFYPTMLHWLEYVQKYSPNILLEKWPAADYRWWFLGDWATPEEIDEGDPRSVGLVVNCAIVDSYDKMIKIAEVLGKKSDAELFVKKKIELSKAVHNAFYNPESATYGSGVQIDLAYPLILGLVPDSLVEKVTKSLYAETLEKRKGHFATGLVGLPILTEWANSTGASEMMHQMMTKKDYPSFGYMIENGATTVWEHWDGNRSRIHNCYNAPGSWFYHSIGGIQPLADYPGYERFLLAPRPPKALTWAKVSKETPFGTIRVGWQKEQGQMLIQVEIPTGSTAKHILPEGVQTCLIDNEIIKPDKQGNIWIESGKYRIKYHLLDRIE